MSLLLGQGMYGASLCWIMHADVAQLVEHRTGTPPMQVRFPRAARDFSPRVNFQCRLSYGVRTSPCAKDAVVHVRVRWITETLKHSACIGGWAARLCYRWLSPGKGNPNFPQKKLNWENTGFLSSSSFFLVFLVLSDVNINITHILFVSKFINRHLH